MNWPDRHHNEFPTSLLDPTCWDKNIFLFEIPLKTFAGICEDVTGMIFFTPPPFPRTSYSLLRLWRDLPARRHTLVDGLFPFRTKLNEWISLNGRENVCELPLSTSLVLTSVFWSFFFFSTAANHVLAMMEADCSIVPKIGRSLASGEKVQGISNRFWGKIIHCFYYCIGKGGLDTCLFVRGSESSKSLGRPFSIWSIGLLPFRCAFSFALPFIPRTNNIWLEKLKTGSGIKYIYVFSHSHGAFQFSFLFLLAFRGFAASRVVWKG